MASQQPPPQPRTCAHSCLEYLLIETVKHYKTDLHGPHYQVALEAIGLRIGRQFIERLTKDRPPMLEQLDKIKFMCKEFWTELFKKSVDNLRTNHRGTYVLRDTQFRWLASLSQNLVSQPLRIAASELAHDHLILPCAIIKGALNHLGLDTTVSADATGLPQCDFTVVITAQQPTSL